MKISFPVWIWIVQDRGFPRETGPSAFVRIPDVEKRSNMTE
jgi:hypothetical protein